MAQYKTSHTFYSAWNYEKEIEDLNAESEKGWQLVRGGCFFSRFEQNPNLQYRYQLDFGRIDNMGRYIETFRDQGWEYLNSTFNNWHYFRKLYDPSLPESAYEIFTDRESLQEMRSKWANIALALGIVLGLFGLVCLIRLIRQPHLPVLVQTLVFLAESILLLRGVGIMKNPETSHKRKGDSLLTGWVLGIIIAGSIVFLTLSSLRPDLRSEQSWKDNDFAASEAALKDWIGFEVIYPDNYFLDLSIEAEQPVTVSIVKENGDVVYTVTESDWEKEDIRLPLKKGEYRLLLTNYGTGAAQLKAHIH